MIGRAWHALQIVCPELTLALYDVLFVLLVVCCRILRHWLAQPPGQPVHVASYMLAALLAA